MVNEANIGNLIDVIKYPLVTEKSTKLNENNSYSFIVDKKSTKETIKLAIEYLFSLEKWPPNHPVLTGSIFLVAEFIKFANK